MEEQLPIQVRELRDEDWGLIKHSWKKSLFNQKNSALRGWRWMDFDHAMETVLWESKTRAKFWVACDPDDEDTIFGWICYDPHAIHYLFVKTAFRRAYVASRLVAAAGFGREFILCSHWTSVCTEIAKTKPIVYAPSRADKLWRNKKMESGCEKGYSHQDSDSREGHHRLEYAEQAVGR